MNKQLIKSFEELMFNTCREQMDEVKNYNGADAGEKLRRCYNKFYMLIKHQNDYYNSLTPAQFEDVMHK